MSQARKVKDFCSRYPNIDRHKRLERLVVKCCNPVCYPRFLSVLPPPAGTGGTFSFFAAGFRPTAGALAGAGFLATAGALLVAAAGLVTMVVPALVLLASLLLRSASGVGAPRLPCRLGTREVGLGGARCCIDGLTGLIGRMAAGFSGTTGLNGERGRVRELCDFGERTLEGTTFRDAVRVAFMFAAVAVLVRFFGFARSCADSAGMFSLSSPVDIWSLRECQPRAIR